jgi:Na+/melibiose symporter-like transporter
LNEKKKLSELTVSAFALGTFGAGLYYSLVNSYFNYYVTDVAGVDAGILGTASFIVRLLFVIITPLLGVMVQNGHSKVGKYRIWLFIGVPLSVLFTILTFTTFSGGMVFLAIFYSFAYTLSSGSSSLCGDAQMSLMNVITNDPAQQRRLSTRRSQFQDLSKILFSATFLPLVALIGGENKAVGYHWTALIIAILAGLGYLCTAWSGKKSDIYDGRDNQAIEAAKTKLTGKQMADCVFKNRPLICMLISETLKFTAFMVFISTFAYYYQYILGDFSAITLTTTIASVVALCSSLLAPIIIKKIGSKNAGIAALACYAIGCFGVRILAPSTLTFGIGFCIIYFGMSLNCCAAPLQFVNSSLYYQSRTGLNATGFVMSLYVFPVQLGIAISSGLANWLLAGIGYSSGITLTAAQTVGMQNIILLVPGLMFLAAIVTNIIYPLNEKKMGEVYAAISK